MEKVISLISSLNGVNFSFLYWVLAFLLGCVSAFAELLSRYTDGFKILKFKESYFYLAINGSASLLAYSFMINFEINLGLLTNSEIGKVIASGLFSMIILRSSLASIKIDDKIWEAGLAPILQIFLNTVDRAFDQSRSKMTIKEVGRIMKDVDFKVAHTALPLLCFSAMQNLSTEEQQKAAEDINVIADENYSGEIKSLNLGIILSKYTGLSLLEAMVFEFNHAITTDDSEPEKVQPENPIHEQQEIIRNLKKKFNF